MKIQQAIDKIIANVPGAPLKGTVDTVKVGDTNQELKGIVTCFLATVEVIENALKTGANLIICHEPLFYNHLDETDWLESDPVYGAKRAKLDQYNIVVWRFHDYLHAIKPDNTVVGLMNALGWRPDEPDSNVTTLAPVRLNDLALRVKSALKLSTIRFVGDKNEFFKRVAVLPGFPPARWQMSVLSEGPTVLIAGEIHEWETSEYVRDSNELRFKKGVIVIGHAASEEPGIQLITKWIQEKLPGVPIQFIPTTHPFQYV